MPEAPILNTNLFSSITPRKSELTITNSITPRKPIENTVTAVTPRIITAQPSKEEIEAEAKVTHKRKL